MSNRNPYLCHRNGRNRQSAAGGHAICRSAIPHLQDREQFLRRVQAQDNAEVEKRIRCAGSRSARLVASPGGATLPPTYRSTVGQNGANGLPFMQTGIAQKDAAIRAPTDCSPVAQVRPVAATDNTGHTGAHVQLAIGVSAEQRIDLKPMHRRSAFRVKNAGMRYTGIIYSNALKLKRSGEAE